MAVTLAVVLSLWVLYVYVSVTSRFGDRIWPIGSKVYSDVTLIRPGDALSAERFATRLADAGYVERDAAPDVAGQFRRSGATLTVVLRKLRSPVAEAPERRREIVFEDRGIRAIRDERGRAVRQLYLEPLVLATLYGPRQEERELVRLDEVPTVLRQAVLAAEDARFESHHGLDLRGIARAAWANLRSGRIVQGGSTITQQTVKNLYLDQRRTFWRKIRETGIALILDARYTKDQILEVYLNEVYLGQRGPVAVCGFGAAARFYFGKGVGELTLAEAATLAGLIRSPGGANPRTAPERAVERRGQVLLAMERLGYIDETQRRAAESAPMRVVGIAPTRSRAPFAVDYVQARLAELYPRGVLNARGLQIYTTIDPLIQGQAETALERGLNRLERRVSTEGEPRRLEGALVVTEPVSGSVRALVGGRDYEVSQFNRASQARRQPGSCFKPVVFAAGFESALRGEPGGLTPATLLEDAPLELVSGGKSWAPANYDREFRGDVTAREALELSLNVPTVRAARRVGLERVVATARDCGIRSPMRPLPSLALGTAEVTPLELATVYGTFAAGGIRTSPWIIRAVLDADGNRLEGERVERARVLSPPTAFLVTDMLSGVLERGTARSARRLGFEGGAAGKTGTTDDTRDAWFVGYDDALLALVWVGYDDNAKTGLTGATGALPIWVDLMTGVHGPRTFRPEVPDEVVRRKIDPATGLLARSGCEDSVTEYFIRGTEPHEQCDLHRGRFRRWLDRFLGKKDKKGKRDDDVSG